MTIDPAYRFLAGEEPSPAKLDAMFCVRPSVYAVDNWDARGDGVSDDTAAISKAFAAAGPGDTVVFTAGKTYAITSPVAIVADYVTVIGTGVKIVSLAPGQDRKFTVSGRKGIRFRDLQIDGGGLTVLTAAVAFDTYSPQTDPGTIHFADSTDCDVEGCKFKGVNWPVTLLGACDDVRVSVCRFETYYAGVYSYFSTATGAPSPTQVTVSRCTFLAGLWPASVTPPQFYLRNYPPQNVFCSGAIKFRAAESVPFFKFQGHRIIGNTIRASGQMGIEMQGGANDCSVCSNTIENTMEGISLSLVQRVNLIGNTIKNTFYTGIEVDGRPDFDTTQESIDTIVIAGNTIDGRDDWGRPVNFVNSFGIVVSHVGRNVVISGGVIKYCKSGIVLLTLSGSVAVNGVRVITNEEYGYGGIGNYTGAVPEPYVQGILVQDSSDVDIVGCTFVPSPNSWQRMVNLINATNVNVRSCSITANNTCVYAFNSSEVTIDNCKLTMGAVQGGSNPGWIAVDSSAGDCQHIRITGCEFRGSTQYGVRLFSPQNTVDPVVIASNDCAQASCSASRFITVDLTPFGIFTGGTAGRIDVQNNRGAGISRANNIEVVVLPSSATFDDDPTVTEVVCSFDQTVNLQSAVGYCGKAKTFVCATQFSTITIHPKPGESINGSTGDLVLRAQWQSVNLRSDGSNWVAVITPAFNGLKQVTKADFTYNFGTIAAGDQAFANLVVDCASGTAHRSLAIVGWTGNLPVGVVQKQVYVSAVNQVTLVIHNSTPSSQVVGSMDFSISVFDF